MQPDTALIRSIKCFKRLRRQQSSSFDSTEDEEEDLV